MKINYSTIVLFSLIAWTHAAGAEEAAEGLINRWQFQPDHLQGSILRATAGELHGNIVGPIVFSSERPQSILLDGDSAKRHRVELAPNVSSARLPSQAMTVEAWVRVDEPLEWGGIIGAIQDNGGYEKGWLLGFRNAQFCFAVATESGRKLNYLTSGVTFEPTCWYHVVGSFDGHQQRIFVDGKLKAISKEQAGPIAYSPTGPYTIGAYHDENELYTMTGRIEQISVWERALDGKNATGFDL